MPKFRIGDRVRHTFPPYLDNMTIIGIDTSLYPTEYYLDTNGVMPKSMVFSEFGLKLQPESVHKEHKTDPETTMEAKRDAIFRSIF